MVDLGKTIVLRIAFKIILIHKHILTHGAPLLDCRLMIAKDAIRFSYVAGDARFTSFNRYLGIWDMHLRGLKSIKVDDETVRLMRDDFVAVSRVLPLSKET